MAEVIAKDAVISSDGLYRYELTRKWSEGDAVTFIMLNPSTADATIDDRTIRRCVNFAKAFGAGSLKVVNLYAYRATNPRELWNVADPVGTDNDSYLKEAAQNSSMVVAAWGAHAKEDRVKKVVGIFDKKVLFALGLTKAGNPRHPLYVRGDAQAVPFVLAGNGGSL